MFMSMVVMFYYRASMNSFLTAKVFTLPINSLEDILNSELDFIVHRGLYQEELFMHASGGSVLKEIYDRKLLGKKRFGDYEDVIELVKNDKAILFTSVEPFIVREDYPCDIIVVKHIRYKYQWRS